MASNETQMTRGEKQLRFMMYAKIKHPNITVGQAARLLKRFECKLDTMMNEKV